MTIEADLVTFLNAQGAVTALVSDKIAVESDIESPLGEYISISRTGTDSEYTLEGGAPLVETIRVDIDCHSTRNAASAVGTATAAEAVAEAVKTALSGYNGTVGATAKAWVTLQDRDSSYDDNTGTHTVSLTFQVLV